MAEISNNGLFCVKNTIENLQLLDEGGKDITCIVLSIRRYTSEPQCSGRQTECNDVYDIVLHDGTCQEKMVLNENLNCMVISNELHVGCSVLFNPSDCDIRYDETRLSSSCVMFLNKLTLVSRESTSHIQNLSASPPDVTEHPLITGRGSYLSLLCNEDPYGDSWYDREADEERVKVRYNTLGSVKSLSDSLKTARRQDYLPLLVRILHRSRLRYYGRSTKPNKWPYQAFLEVADQSGVCSLVLWNAMCPELYTRLSEGTLLYIEGYTLKRCFEQMSRARVRNPALTVYSVEIGVNKHHPKAQVVILREAQVPARHLPPPIVYHFLNRRELSSVPHNYNVDIVGMVLYIGRCQRLHNGKRGFWLYRWLELMDGSSPQAIRVELFATSQPEMHRRLAIGCVLVATQMRLVHGVENVTSSRQSQPRTLYVTTTNESQIYVHSGADLKGPYSKEEPVLRVQQWSQSEEALQLTEERGSVAGYYNYPRLPSTLEKYTDSYKEKGELKILSTEELQHLVGQLEYLEFRRVHLQGFVAGITTRRDPGALDSAPEDDDPSGETSSIGHTLRSGKTTGRAETGVKRVVSSAPKAKKKRKRKSASAGWKEAKNEEQHVILRDIMHSFNIPAVGETLPAEFRRRLYRVDNPEDCSILNMYVHTPPSVYTPSLYIKDRTLQDLPRFDKDDHLSIQLTGLHRNIRINASILVPSDVSSDTTLLDLLSGQSTVQSVSTGQGTSGRTIVNGNTECDVRKLITTRTQLEHKRMLFVLDLFSYGKARTEITLNRAYPVPE